MNETRPGAAFDPARHCDAMAPALGLTITEGQRPAVLQFLAIAHLMSQIVATAPLGDASFELAPVFTPGTTGTSR